MCLYCIQQHLGRDCFICYGYYIIQSHIFIEIVLYQNMLFMRLLLQEILSLMFLGWGDFNILSNKMTKKT